MTEALSQIELSKSEIAKLPAPLRRKIQAAFGPADMANGTWMLVGAASAVTARVIDRAIAQIALVASNYAAARSERNIERLLEMIVEDIPRHPVDIELEIENAGMRAEYLAENNLLTAQEVRDRSGLKPRNRSEPASRWKREGKIFAVRKGAIDLYPAFQFVDGSPRPVIKKILAELGDEFTAWQVAFWFQSGNGWLDGEEPRDCLDQVDDVVMAARRLAEPTIG
ncbi:MAG: hypothetical protein OXC91_02875 [Rhodobacteraceae bacterium]|nr:hypothetical protein [Paracoccaceae bacterium]